MSDLEKSVRSIIERNRRSRTAFNEMSSQVASLSMATTVEQIDEINAGLEKQLHGFLETARESPDPSGTDGGSAHEGNVGGTSTEQ